MVDLLIPGPEGKIEAKYTHNNNNDSPIVIILHPDPTKGGTMHTKIVFRLYKIFIEAGFSSVRFNFRGVVKSEGVFDNQDQQKYIGGRKRRGHHQNEGSRHERDCQ